MKFNNMKARFPKIIFLVAGVGVIFICFLVYSLFKKSPEQEFSVRWKAASPQERGFMVDPELLERVLFGKTRQEVIKFLGEPDKKGPILIDPDGKQRIPAKDGVILPDNFMYDCGNRNGPYQWTFIVSFDENGQVYQIGLDD